MSPPFLGILSRLSKSTQPDGSCSTDERFQECSVRDEQLRLPDDQLEEVCQACADVAAYAEQVESQLKIEKRAATELYQICLKTRLSKSRLKESIEQKDLEVRQLQKEISEKAAEIQQIRAESLRYKRAISAFNKNSKQILDTSIQRDMEATFCCIRDWVLDVVRKEQLELRPEPEFADWLLTTVPQFEDNAAGFQVNSVVVGLSEILLAILDDDHVFGYASNGVVAEANKLHRSMRAIEVSEQRKKQWIITTNEILAHDDASAKQAAEDFLEVFVTEAEGIVSRACSKPVSSEAARRLRRAIQPRIAALQALRFQEAEYRLHLFHIPRDGQRISFDTSAMEDVNGYTMGDVDGCETPSLETIWFPALIKRDVGENNDKAEWTVVSKAKVQLSYGWTEMDPIDEAFLDRDSLVISPSRLLGFLATFIQSYEGAIAIASIWTVTDPNITH
ncbi:hypothetical protein M436DRAFT_68310 [Aureobasidium namibiae CBS 147.97]|uniref:Uncharacterized protein n=1 Tax=Aureobasidium namibiae CBS 147.97 TaxID=1043004 RepID=A0A074W9F3_9PEZI